MVTVGRGGARRASRAKTRSMPSLSQGQEAMSAVGRAAAQLARCYQSYLDALVQPFGLSASHVPLLAHLWEGNSGETQNDIARALGVDKGTVSRNVQALAQLGFVEQRASLLDSRACTVELTPAGRRLAKPIVEMSSTWSEGITAGMSAESIAELQERLVSMSSRAQSLLEEVTSTKSGRKTRSLSRDSLVVDGTLDSQISL